MRTNQMITAYATCEEDLQYAVSFRQLQRIEREDTPPPGRFETTSRDRLARAARYRRDGNCARRGIQQRGTAQTRF